MIKDVIEYFAENNRLIVLSNDITLSINSKAIAYYIVEWTKKCIPPVEKIVLKTLTGERAEGEDIF